MRKRSSGRAELAILMSSEIPRHFVRSAPSRTDKHHSVDLKMTDMGAADAAWWDARLGPHHVKIETRADRFWPWSALLPMCHLVQLAKRRYCRPLVIWARTDSGRFLRVGMSIFIETYPYLDVSTRADSVFVWFISSAEPTVLRENFGMSHPPALGRVLLDNAIVLSQNAGLAGRIGLHAARAGGSQLLRIYQNCGLIRLSEDMPLPTEVRRENDGRFFYADPGRAESLAAMLDPRR
jgi:hypothetical protein